MKTEHRSISVRELYCVGLKLESSCVDSSLGSLSVADTVYQ